MTAARTITAITVLTAVLAFGCLLLALGHAGVDVPVVSRFGPGGDAVVAPAAIAFAVAAVGLAVVAWGMTRRRPWSWALGLLAHALIFIGAVMPFRGVGSAVAMIVTAASFALLLTRPARVGLVAR